MINVMLCIFTTSTKDDEGINGRIKRKKIQKRINTSQNTQVETTSELLQAQLLAKLGIKICKMPSNLYDLGQRIRSFYQKYYFTERMNKLY